MRVPDQINSQECVRVSWREVHGEGELEYNRISRAGVSVVAVEEVADVRSAGFSSCQWDQARAQADADVNVLISLRLSILPFAENPLNAITQ